MPQLARRLPRPGPWMERLKQLLSFPMFATAAWLVWVLSVQAGPSGVAAVLAGMIALAFALWLSEAARHARSPWHQAASVTAVVGFGLALWLGLALESERRPPSAALASASASDPAADITVTPYSPMRLAEARAAGRPVFVNMTAAWCITCLVNERVALSGDAVARAFADADILYLKGDWTNRDPAITDYLAAFGRNGVPIYVFYPSGGEPKLLPQILTEAVVLAALKHQAISGQRSVSSRTGPIP
jgi:thiol:disulfide interchange protein